MNKTGNISNGRTKNMNKYTKKFGEGEPYTQESGPDCKFSAILKKGEVGDMQAGLVCMKGPTWNEPASHDKWHQFYILLKGKGIMKIGDEKFPVMAPSIIKIPYNTLHAMEVEKGEYVEYIYVNQNIKKESREK